MKPAPFEYVKAGSVEEALQALTEDAVILAGGQSLIPRLNARERRPGRLVDINHAGLGVIRRTDGVLRIGATVHQAALERSRIVKEHWPLLAEVARRVGHVATRTRGTVGGTVMHADPRAQLPIALLALDAELVMQGPLLVELAVPPLPEGARTGYAEHGRGWPEAAAAVVRAPGYARVVVTGGRAREVEHALLDGASPREAAELVGGEGHRHALLADVTRRALAQC